MLISTDHCDLVPRWFGSKARIEREATDVVRFEAIRLLVVTQTKVSFLDADGNRIGPTFVPMRPKKVLAALDTFGWPVSRTRLGLRGRVNLSPA